MASNPLLSSDLHMGSPVYASNGEKIGRLRFTVSDPEPPHAVRQLVVEKGMLLHRDTMIPVEAIKSSEMSGIRLGLNAEQIQELPEFIETRWFQRESGGGGGGGQGGQGGQGGRDKRGRRSGRRGHHH